MDWGQPLSAASSAAMPATRDTVALSRLSEKFALSLVTRTAYGGFGETENRSESFFSLGWPWNTYTCRSEPSGCRGCAVFTTPRFEPLSMAMQETEKPVPDPVRPRARRYTSACAHCFRERARCTASSISSSGEERGRASGHMYSPSDSYFDSGGQRRTLKTRSIGPLSRHSSLSSCSAALTASCSS